MESAGAAGSHPGQGSGTPEGSQPQQQQQQEQQQPDLSKFVTAEQVGEIVNKAITNRNTAFEKKLAALLDEREAALSTKIVDALGDKLKTLEKPEPDKGGDKGDKGKKAGAAAEVPPELRELQEQLQKQSQDLGKLRKEAEQAREEAAAERRKARAANLRQRTLDELAKHNLTGSRGNLALASLLDKIAYADEKGDDLVFRRGEDAVALEDGLKAWLDTDDARVLLPPRGAKGSGDGPPARAAQTGNQNTTARDLGEGLLGFWSVGGNARPTG